MTVRRGAQGNDAGRSAMTSIAKKIQKPMKAVENHQGQPLMNLRFVAVFMI